MSAPAPIPFRWSGEIMEPLPRFTKQCDATFVVGMVYRLAVIEDRSGVSHRHYFAQVREGWMNLPEALGSEFPTDIHLRKRGLIACGYANSRQIVAPSRAKALEIAAFIRPMDEYALVQVEDRVITVWTARSQDLRSMAKKEFQDSKQAVLDWISALIGVKPTDLAENAERSAA